MKSIKDYFPVVLFIMLNKVDLTFESIDETLKCKTCKWNLLSITFLWYCFKYYAVQVEVALSFESVEGIL